MTLGVTLGQLIEDVQLEANLSATPNVGQNFRAQIAHRIRKEQEYLHADFRWPHMEGTLTSGWFDKDSANGERYYDYPANLDQQRGFNLHYQFGSVYVPVERGITPEDYVSFNSDNGVGSDPVMKWAPHTQTQFEVWPIPQVDGNILRFTGFRTLRPLLADTDVADLDDNLITLFAAGRLLIRRNKDEAAVVLKRAEKLYASLKMDAMRGTNFSMATPGEGKIDPRDPNNRILTATRP